MAHQKHISDEKFIHIIKTSKNIRQALIALDYKPSGGNYEALIIRCKKLGINPPEIAMRICKEKELLTDEDIILACNFAQGNTSAIRTLGLSSNNTNIQWLQEQILRLKIDTSHWIITKASYNGTPLEKILTSDSYYGNTNRLRIRLLKEGLLQNQCVICGLSDAWQGKPITLHLDHINGDRFDNRLENLRILCPNCHSQTPTYSGKNIKRIGLSPKLPKQRRKKQSLKQCACGKQIKPCNERCKACEYARRSSEEYRAVKLQTSLKINWPSLNDLINMVQEQGFFSVGKTLGVSDNAIRKHLKRRGVDLSQFKYPKRK